MDPIHITYKDVKSNAFQSFIEKTSVHLSQSIKSGNLDKTICTTINKLIGGYLNYFLDFEMVHSVVHSVLIGVTHTIDTILLDELIPYTLIKYSGEDATLIERMKTDVVMLLMLRGKEYYQLAWNDWDSFNLISVKGFKYLRKGIWNGIKNKNANVGFAYGYLELVEEKYRIHAIGLHNIRQLIMLYLYGIYSVTKNIEYTSAIILYLCASGYSWLSIPSELETDILKDFLEFQIPNVISGIKKVDLLDIYMNAENYRAQLVQAYPYASETILREIQQFTKLPDKYSELN